MENKHKKKTLAQHFNDKSDVLKELTPEMLIASMYLDELEKGTITKSHQTWLLDYLKSLKKTGKPFYRMK